MRRFKLNKILYLAVIASLTSLTPSALAQAVYGSIFGTITDNSGAVVPNAKITITDVAKGTSVQTQSGAGGDYRVQHLIPDSYRVDVEAPGFSKSTADNVVVYADTSPKVDLQLSVAGATNTVTVSSRRPAAANGPGGSQHHLECARGRKFTQLQPEFHFL